MAKDLQSRSRDRRFSRPGSDAGKAFLRACSTRFQRTGPSLFLRPLPTYSQSQIMGLIEEANGLPLSTFRSRYLVSLETEVSFSHAGSDSPKYEVTFESSASIHGRDLSACFDLIQETSADIYAKSDVGWSPAKKRKEMQLPDMRYLLVKESKKQSSPDHEHESVFAPSSLNSGPATRSNQSSEAASEARQLAGFLSFMPTYEDGKEVVYCYELHLSPLLRGKGVGKKLMSQMEDVGRQIGVCKAMLTVFVDNENGLRFYERVGYVEDEFSPAPIRLRNGKVKKASYVILSKALE
ncbi:MAG: hypothetical protein M1837_002431 [Sclerophora amabilis]|nr:MAG: hypothetical protein M1837_002431 [Sclerophora amabilis]